MARKKKPTDTPTVENTVMGTGANSGDYSIQAGDQGEGSKRYKSFNTAQQMRDYYQEVSDSQNKPWHGANFPDMSPGIDFDQICNNSNINWDVASTPIYLEKPLHLQVEGEDKMDTFPGEYALQRQDTGYPLGIVSGQYEIVQNREVLDWHRPFFDSGICNFESAGVFKGGKRCWLMVRMAKDPLMPVNEDPILPYLIFTHGFDGKTSVKIHPTMTRVWCLNQMPGLFSKNNHLGVRLHHRKGVKEALDVVQDLTMQAYAGMKDVEAALAQLANKNVVNQQSLETYFRRVLKLPFRDPKEIIQDEEKFQKELERGQRSLQWMFEAYDQESYTMADSAKDSWYHAFNAVTRHITHNRPSSSHEIRWQKTMFGGPANTRDRAFEYALEEVAS
jgi:phage/plasmid-like protein (TIGR03299 family)